MRKENLFFFLKKNPVSALFCFFCLTPIWEIKISSTELENQNSCCGLAGSSRLSENTLSNSTLSDEVLSPEPGAEVRFLY